MVCRSGRYWSIVNGGNGGGRVKSNGRGNQQNQRKNAIFLQQYINGGNYNSFHLRISLCQGKMVQIALCKSNTIMNENIF